MNDGHQHLSYLVMMLFSVSDTMRWTLSYVAAWLSPVVTLTRSMSRMGQSTLLSLSLPHLLLPLLVLLPPRTNAQAIGTTSSLANIQGQALLIYDSSTMYGLSNSAKSLYKIDLSTGAITTLNTGLSNPRGLCWTDSSKTVLLIADFTDIKRYTLSTSTLETVVSGFSSHVLNLKIVGSTVYHTVKHAINSFTYPSSGTATSTIISGLTDTGGYVDGTSAARWNLPMGMALHGTDTIYFGSHNNHVIRKLNLNNIEVTTVVGTGSVGLADGAGTNVKMQYCRSVYVDSSTGLLYFGGQYLLRKADMNNNWEVTTYIGSGIEGEADGLATAAKVNRISALAVSGDKIYYGSTRLSWVHSAVVLTAPPTPAPVSSPGASSPGVEGFQLPTSCMEHPTRKTSTCSIV